MLAFVDVALLITVFLKAAVLVLDLDAVVDAVSLMDCVFKLDRFCSGFGGSLVVVVVVIRHYHRLGKVR